MQRILAGLLISLFLAGGGVTSGHAETLLHTTGRTIACIAPDAVRYLNRHHAGTARERAAARRRWREGGCYAVAPRQGWARIGRAHGLLLMRRVPPTVGIPPLYFLPDALAAASAPATRGRTAAAPPPAPSVAPAPAAPVTPLPVSPAPLSPPASSLAIPPQMAPAATRTDPGTAAAGPVKTTQLTEPAPATLAPDDPVSAQPAPTQPVPAQPAPAQPVAAVPPATMPVGPLSHVSTAVIGLLVLVGLGALVAFAWRVASRRPAPASVAAIGAGGLGVGPEDPGEYERTCLESLVRAGWAARPAPPGQDGGIDIFAERQGVRLVLRCEALEPADDEAVRNVEAARRQFDADRAVIVSELDPAGGTLRQARRNKVSLLRRAELAGFQP